MNAGVIEAINFFVEIILQDAQSVQDLNLIANHKGREVKLMLSNEEAANRMIEKFKQLSDADQIKWIDRLKLVTVRTKYSREKLANWEKYSNRPK
jgi:hypothetical protein